MPASPETAKIFYAFAVNKKNEKCNNLCEKMHLALFPQNA